MSQKNRPIKTVLCVAIAVALHSGAVQAQEEAGTTRILEEIIVTASRRSESLQDVPIAVQAMSGKKLRELGIDSFEDYIAVLPGVNAQGQAPGKQEVFMRGVTPGRNSAVRLSGISGEPSVAIYLDETPVTTPGRNIDLYAIDLQRIEVLKGPQGTLFGASSQAGNVRMITNKPDFDGFSAGGVVGLSSTRSGGTSTKVEAYANIPLVDDKFAVRVVGYSSTDAGYIDNIPAETSIPDTNPTLLAGGIVPATRQTTNNHPFAEDDYNNATFRGIRVSALWQINDDWDLLLQHTDQQLDTEGSFEYDPSISTDDDLNVTTFSPMEGDDHVNLTQWTLNGMLGGLEVIYNGSFTEREFNGQTDYTGYIEIGPFVPYYICTYPGYDECFTPVMNTLEHFKTDRIVQEVRVSTSAENRLRAIGGVFYDDQQLNFLTDFLYSGSIPAGFFPNWPIPGAFTNTSGELCDPVACDGPRPAGVTFFNDFQADREEISVFGEIAYDFTDDITATFGARRYDLEIGMMGQSPWGQRAPGPEADAGVNVDERLAGETPTTLSDTIIKVNLSWQMNDDALVYFTYSEGFRGGGFNRAAGVGGIPASFDTDDAENWELGWKTIWLDNTLRLNGALYFVDFSNLQQGVLDFSIANTTFFTNVGSAEIKGLEFEIEWAAQENLDLFGSFTYIDSELTEIPVTLVNIAPLGSELPFAPETEGLFGARFHKDMGEFNVFAQGIFKWRDSIFNSLIAEARVELPSYTQFDLAVGVGKDEWQATVFIDNVTDTLGQLTAGSADNIFRVVPTRPRTIGFRLSYDY